MAQPPPYVGNVPPPRYHSHEDPLSHTYTNSNAFASSSAMAREQPPDLEPCISPSLLKPATTYDAESFLLDEPFPSNITASPTSSRGLSASPTPSSASIHSIHSGSFITSKRRNVQVAPSTSNPTNALTATNARNRWKCPHCPHIQRNRRTPDLKRHIATHASGENERLWVCCGVPVVDAPEFGIPAEVIKEWPVFEFEGMFMLGGCKRTFSRRDAYKRHLKREVGNCFGDPQAAYQPGNRVVD
ncbi:hypothetical protein C8Q76DRAFT_726672 [Earliella scabrosa]|nr:hypothetical protein C8Q76DRAFT_726672 [Earliella scabrosa]